MNDGVSRLFQRSVSQRRSARMLCVTAAVAGLVCAILPVLFLVWLAMIWSSA